MLKKLASLLVSLAMICPTAAINAEDIETTSDEPVVAEAGENVSDSAADTAESQTEETTTDEKADDTETEDDTQSDTAETGAAAQSEDDSEEDFELTILYTNDVHTYINKTLSYANIAEMKDDIEEEGGNVLLVDAGDHAQGTAYGGMDNGKSIIQIMNAAGYDLATFGNHEFDYGMARALEFTEEADFPYVSCNFRHGSDENPGELVEDPYEVFEFDGVKVAFVGVTTPETFTKSTPAYFMNEDQTEYIYTIDRLNDGQDLYDSVQAAVDAAHEEADYVIVLGHLGVDGSSAPWRSTDVIANVSGIDAWIDGHSHTTVEKEMVTDKDGEEVVLTQTGSYFAAVGEMTITEDGIDTKLVTEYEGSDETVAEMQNAWMTEVNDELGTEIAETDIDFTVNRADGTRAVREEETNLGDLNADAYYYYFNMVEGLDCDVAIMNGGGVRASIAAGTWSYNTCKTVNPFGNVICLMEVTGQTILDALEWGAQYTPDKENGGFLQTAGITYDIDTTVENTIVKDDHGVWSAGPTDGYRVKNVKVYNKTTGEYEPLDLTKTYTFAGTNYTLRSLGDGFNMFGDAVLIKDYVSEDYLAMAAYVSAFTDTDDDGLGNIATENSPLAVYDGYLMNYEDPTGAGRITIVDTAATGTQKLHIEGDDWGPGVDKTVITLDTEVAASDLDPENFTVTEIKEATDWANNPYAACISTSERTILDVYLSDEEGNPVDAAEGNIITVEMYISPSEGSPFRYVLQSGYNKWCEPYELDVEGRAGNVWISSDVEFDLTDDTQWFNEEAQSFDVDNTYTDSNGYTYVYGEYTPEEDDHTNALIIWLHGAGEGQASNVEEYQNDNYIDILGNEVTAYVSDEFQDLFDGAYVITPQAPTMWMDYTGNGDYNTSIEGQPSVYSEGLFELIEDYVANNPDIDTDRIIIGGCSNGGYMTMRMVIDHPDYFYKAFPIAEAMLDTNISDEQIQAIVDGGTGIWFTYADTDTTVDPTTNAQPTVERLKAAGADVHVTEWAKTEDLSGRFDSEDGTHYEYSGHWSWIYFDNNEDETCDVHGDENEWEWLALTKTRTYDNEQTVIHITGDDWGPGVDAVTIKLGDTVTEKELAKAEITVTEIKEATDWANNPYAACIATAERTVTGAYLSDEEGNPVDAAEGNIITVEMYISPSEGSPFRYVLQSGFNKWCDPYELVVSAEIGDTDYYSIKDYDLTDDTEWVSEEAEKFDVTKTYTDSKGYTYQYGEYAPEAAATDGQQNALVIWLHGAGEGQAEGQEYHNDNYIDLLGNEVTALISDEFQDLFNSAYVITPQAPTMWMDDGTGAYTSDGTSCYSTGLFELIENYVANNPDVDPNRIIIGGCSNGGFMTMRMVVDHPDYFYKAYPICEALSDSCITDEQIQAIADSHTGIWFTYALTDTTVDPTVYSQPTIQRLIAAGADVHYTEWEKTEDRSGRFDSEDGTHYEYTGHWSWIYFDNNENTTCDVDGTENEWVYLAAYTNVKINGEVINKKYYTVDENGKPTLTSAYIATLKPGEYKMTVSFNGTVKNYKFTIEAQADGSKKAVDTSDTFHAGILGGTMAACAALIAAAWFALKRRK